MKTVLQIAMIFLISGCTHSLYEAKFTELNNEGNKKDFQLYWTKTDPVIGSVTADSAVLLERCSNSKYTFVNSDKGIVMTASRGDLTPILTQVNQPLICGTITGINRLENFQESDQLSLAILCNPIVDPFSSRTILNAKVIPYKIDVRLSEEEFSLNFDGAITPEPLTCSESE